MAKGEALELGLLDLSLTGHLIHTGVAEGTRRPQSWGPGARVQWERTSQRKGLWSSPNWEHLWKSATCNTRLTSQGVSIP